MKGEGKGRAWIICQNLYEIGTSRAEHDRQKKDESIISAWKVLISMLSLSDNSSMVSKISLDTDYRHLNWMLWTIQLSISATASDNTTVWQGCLGPAELPWGIPPGLQSLRCAHGLQPAPFRCFRYACVWQITCGLRLSRFIEPLVPISSNGAWTTITHAHG